MSFGTPISRAQARHLSPPVFPVNLRICRARLNQMHHISRYQRLTRLVKLADQIRIRGSILLGHKPERASRRSGKVSFSSRMDASTESLRHASVLKGVQRNNIGIWPGEPSLPKSTWPIRRCRSVQFSRATVRRNRKARSNEATPRYT